MKNNKKKYGNVLKRVVPMCRKKHIFVKFNLSHRLKISINNKKVSNVTTALYQYIVVFNSIFKYLYLHH